MASAIPYIIAAASVASVSESQKARRQASRQASAAQAQAAEQGAVVERQVEEQIVVQREQADVGRQRLEAETARFAEEKAKLEADAKKRTGELETAQREMGERESSRLRASRRSGRRSLLSQQRLSPELGLNSGGTSLSPTIQTARMM